MNWSKTRKPDLESDLALLISDLCSNWGFCNQLTGEQLIAERGELSADQFAAYVLVAEGMNPEYEIAWRRRIRDAFKARYGTEISAATYRPSSE